MGFVYQGFAEMTTRNPTDSERKLASIAVELAILAAEYMADKTTQEVAEWAAGQLRECGFENIPRGMEWAYLTKVKE